MTLRVMSKEEISAVRETLVELVDTVKNSIQEEPSNLMLLEGDFIILADIRNLLHLANEGKTVKLSIMLDAYRSSKNRGDSLSKIIDVISEVIDQDREEY